MQRTIKTVILTTVMFLGCGSTSLHAAESDKVFHAAWEAAMANLRNRTDAVKQTPSLDDVLLNNCNARRAPLEKERCNTSIIIEDKQAFLEEQFYEFIETLSDSARQKFNKFLEQCGEEVVKERMFNAIKMILYNKKHFIIDSRKVIGHDPFVNKQIEFVL